MSRTHRAAFTLIELVFVLAITGLMMLIVVRPLRGYLDRLATRAAATEAALLVTRARDEALAQHTAVAVRIDTVAETIELRARGERIVIRALGELHGVALSTTRDSIAFDARGLGYGAANMTLTVRKRAASGTVVVSRLGRVRY